MKVLFALIFFIVSCQSLSDKKVVCYWGSWAAYRKNEAKFTVDKIDPTICTHIIYTFFGIHDNGTVMSLDPHLDYSDNNGQGYISKLIKLRKKNPALKFLAAIGGWNMGGEIFSKIASSQRLRAKFASSCVDFVQKFGFDGIDLDWEYPKSNEKDKYVKLLKDLSNKLHQAGKLLTIAVGATPTRARESYNISEIVSKIDLLFLMSYDFHGDWDRRTGINSPLYSNDDLNVDSCVKFWISQGCPKNKLIVGIPLYGRSFTILNPNSHKIGQPATIGKPGKFFKTAGILPYNEICDQWVGYDDDESVDLKLDYIINNDLGGAMFWSIESDDFGNICGDGKFPLVTLAHDRFNFDPIDSDDDDESSELTEEESDSEEESEEYSDNSDYMESDDNSKPITPIFIQVIMKYQQPKNQLNKN